MSLRLISQTITMVPCYGTLSDEGSSLVRKWGASKLKEEIESKTSTSFRNNVAKHNTWFGDTRRAIIAKEGEGYNEYTRMLFKAYKTSTNAELKEAVKEKEQKWIQDKLKTDYSFTDLFELGRIKYNNQVENENWEAPKETEQSKAAGQPQFLALATKILNKLKTRDKRREIQMHPSITDPRGESTNLGGTRTRWERPQRNCTEPR